MPAISYRSGNDLVEGGTERGNALAAGLSAKALVRIELDGERAREVERYDMGVRIRAVVEGADGALWVLEDGRRGGTGRLLKLTPKG